MVKTLYLFDSSLDYTVTSTENFCFKIRVPGWAQRSAQSTISVNGGSPTVSRSLTVDFIFIIIFSFHFILFFFFFFFSFLFLEQLGLGIISHAVTSVTSWWHSHKTDHGTWENGVEGSGIKWRHITWTTHVGLMSYTWSFRVGCTVVSADHE